MTIRSVVRSVRPIAVPIVIGFMLGALAARLGSEALNAAFGAAGGWSLLVAVLAAYLLSIAVHEAGHVAAALLVDFRPLVFIVGPLRIERVDDRIVWGLNRSLALAGGLAISTPRHSHDLRRRTLVLAAGGPAASLIFSVQCLALFQATSPLLVHAGAAGPVRFTAALLLMLGIGSLIIGVITLIPMRTGGFYSDGARVLRMLRGGPAAEREVALITLTGLTLGGTRPRDWEEGLVRRALEIRDAGAFEVGARMFAYAHALDRNDVATAGAHLEAALEHVAAMPEASRASVLLAAAIFYALFAGDAVRARALLDGAGTRSLISAPHQRRLAEAAVRLAEGNAAVAREHAAAARDLMRHAIDRGGSVLDAALAERILSADTAAR